jgi:hypothetical protein
MLDGALSFVKSARYGKPDKSACLVFFFYGLNIRILLIIYRKPQFF